LHPLAVRWANASTAADRSTPMTVPSGATARARSSAVSPPPQPMSRTLSPGRGASAAKARRPSGASCNSNKSRTSAHARTRTSSWVHIGRDLFWLMWKSLPDGRGMSSSPHGLKVGCWASQRRHNGGAFRRCSDSDSSLRYTGRCQVTASVH
jgi:hypothetical protein